MVDPDFPPLNDQKIVESSHLGNIAYRTHQLVDLDKFPLRETFNALSPVPEQIIDLKDGRELMVQEWNPSGTIDNAAGQCPVRIRGYIRFKEKQDG